MGIQCAWGTFNIITKKDLAEFSIGKKPIDCLEYAILHELTHLQEKNHSNGSENFHPRAGISELDSQCL